MSSALEKFLVVIVMVLGACLFLILVGYLFNRVHNDAIECESLGGVQIKTDKGWLCVSKDSIIPLKPGKKKVGRYL